MTRQELIEIADLFLEGTHSEGFKVAEASDLLSNDYMGFLRPPKPNWKENITKYLTERGYPLPKNRLFI